MEILLFSLLGLFIGCFGTLIGAGGGFLMMPVFFFLFPKESPVHLTSISLAIVFLNALSGSIAYARAGKIEYKSGMLFVLSGIPGAVIGTIVTRNIDERTFYPVFGAFLLTMSIYLIVKSKTKPPAIDQSKPHRVLRERDGTLHIIPKKDLLGSIISSFVGFISSFLGIGGGIVHVPAMTKLLHYPIHIATATSHFVLGCLTGLATLIHIYHDEFGPNIEIILWMGPTVVIGAQIGAHLSQRIKAHFIIRALAGALILVSIRLLFY